MVQRERIISQQHRCKIEFCCFLVEKENGFYGHFGVFPSTSCTPVEPASPARPHRALQGPACAPAPGEPTQSRAVGTGSKDRIFPLQIRFAASSNLLPGAPVCFTLTQHGLWSLRIWTRNTDSASLKAFQRLEVVARSVEGAHNIMCTTYI